MRARRSRGLSDSLLCGCVFTALAILAAAEAHAQDPSTAVASTRLQFEGCATEILDDVELTRVFRVELRGVRDVPAAVLDGEAGERPRAAGADGPRGAADAEVGLRGGCAGAPLELFARRRRAAASLIRLDELDPEPSVRVRTVALVLADLWTSAAVPPERSAGGPNREEQPRPTSPLAVRLSEPPAQDPTGAPPGPRVADGPDSFAPDSSSNRTEWGVGLAAIADLEGGFAEPGLLFGGQGWLRVPLGLALGAPWLSVRLGFGGAFGQAAPADFEGEGELWRVAGLVGTEARVVSAPVGAGRLDLGVALELEPGFAHVAGVSTSVDTDAFSDGTFVFGATAAVRPRWVLGPIAVVANVAFHHVMYGLVGTASDGSVVVSYQGPILRFALGAEVVL